MNPTEEDKTEEDKTEEDKTEEDETEEDETEKEAEKETEEDEKLTDDVATEGDVTSSQRKPATPSQAEASERDKKKTEKKTIRKKIKEIEWELNFVESTEQKFISDIEGTYVYEPVIPSGYEMDIDVSLPQIKVIVEDETEKDGLVLTAEAGDYLVMVSADTDVFPEDVSLLVKLIESKDATENLKQALEELEGNINIADEDLVYFDVTVLDKDGNEVQPDNEKGSITISFENLIEQTEGAERTKVQDYQIYHLDEENQVMEKRDTTVTEQVVQAEMEHFSPVVVRIGRSTGTVSVSNATELISALTNTTGSSITLSDDIKLENMVTMKADHTLVIPSGKTLTIIETLSAGGKILSIQGGGAVRMQGRALRGKIELKDITVWLETEKDNGIRADILNVNAGAKIVVDSSEHKNLISVASSKTLNVNEGGSIEIENFHESAIICDGTININNGGTIAINASGKGNNPSGINLTRNGKINIDGGVLISENSGSIYLIEGSKVQGMANKLSDQGKTFNSGNEVTVGAADTAAADNQLTAGLYVGDRENKFVKASAAATGLKDGILTLTSQAGGVKSEGWNWNKNNLDLNSDFKGCKQIVFATESPAQIKINRGEVKIDGSESAIVVPKDLTIWSNADNNAKLTVNGKIEVQGNVIIDQSTSMDVTANSSDAAFQAGADSTIKISADAKVTVRNQGSGAAMNKAPDTSGYTNIKIIASTDSSGSPKVKYDADGISQYKYLKIEKGSSLNEDSTVDEIVEAVKNMNSDDPDEIDKVANIIREMDPAKRKKHESGNAGKGGTTVTGGNWNHTSYPVGYTARDYRKKNR
uniref:hypothetical protein n=1 Tax=Clostridium sp. NkU-1 TaxID=1095009 RepID=UPI0006D03CEF